MLNLRLNNIYVSRLEKLVWISFNDENKDDRESFYEKIFFIFKFYF